MPDMSPSPTSQLYLCVGTLRKTNQHGQRVMMIFWFLVRDYICFSSRLQTGYICLERQTRGR